VGPGRSNNATQTSSGRGRSRSSGQARERLDADHASAAVVRDDADREFVPRHERGEQVVAHRRPLSLPVGEEDDDAVDAVRRRAGHSGKLAGSA
jgi:hypothetical protein